MRRAIAFLVFVLVGWIPAALGVMAAGCVCVVAWRHEPLRVLVNPHGDPGHPVRWIFPGLCGLFGIILGAGSLALYIPLLRLVPWLDPSRRDWPSKSLHPALYRWMRWSIEWERRFVLAWLRRIRADRRDLDRARKPEPVDQEF